MRCSLLIVLAVTAAMVSCATRVPTVTTPSYPEYIFPTVPVDYIDSLEARRHEDAWAFLQVGNLTTAQSRYSELLNRNPDFYPAVTALGWVSLARGDYQGAVSYFERVTSQQPAYVAAFVGLGETMLVLNETEKALLSFEAALAEDSTLRGIAQIVRELRFTLMSEQLVVARAAAAGSRFSEAKLIYEKIILRSPESAFLKIELGRVELVQGNATEALSMARQAAMLDPMDSAAYLLEGESHEALDNLRAAITAYENADRLNSTEDTIDRLARLNEMVWQSALPPEFQLISEKTAVTRGEVAALMGVRFSSLLRDWAPNRPVIMTDARNHWGTAWIQSVTQAGIMSVDAGYRFNPSREVRRSELAEAVANMLTLFAEIDPVIALRWEDSQPEFLDMRPGHLSYPFAAKAVAAGVLDSVEDGMFQPTRTISGDQAVDAIDRLMQLARELQ